MPSPISLNSQKYAQLSIYVFFLHSKFCMGMAGQSKIEKELAPDRAASNGRPGAVVERTQQHRHNDDRDDGAGNQINNHFIRRKFFLVDGCHATLESHLGKITIHQDSPCPAKPEEADGEQGEKKNPGPLWAKS
jgi:hypothetical protein